MQLRPYQIRAIEALRAAYARGRRAPCLVMPCGGGKTVVAAAIIASAAERGTRTLFVADRSTLIEQTGRKLRDAGVGRIRVIQAERDEGPRDASATVASAQTLRTQRWMAKLPEADLVIWDECFPAGTMVDGRPIESIEVGDMMRSYNDRTRSVELRTVTRLFKSIPSAMVTIKTSSGRRITCTAGHPFFDGSGYTAACKLRLGDWLYGKVSEDVVHGMRSGDCPDRNDENEFTPERDGLLLYGLQRPEEESHRIRDNVENQHQGLEADLRSDEDEESNGELRCQSEIPKDAPYHRTSTEGTRRERIRSHPNGTAAARCASDRMEVEFFGSHVHSPWHRAVDALQDRRSEPGEHGSGGGGRAESLLLGASVTGCQETGVSRIDRVESVTVHKQRSDDGFGHMCPDGYVYNFEVEVNHNYFVDGILVHNCHHVAAATYEQTVARYPRARLLGLTATPCRGDNKPLAMYDELVVGATIAELTALGNLVPPHVLAPPSQLEAAEVALDPVDAYRLHARNRRAALFCASVEQARRYVLELEAHGITARLVHATSPDRSETLAEFAADGFRVLASVGTLCEGWDDPGCGVAIVARRCGSVGLWLQICGRVLRPSPGKTEGLIIDLCGSVHEHGLPDAEREYSLDGKAISSIRKDTVRQCKTCGSMYAAGPRACPWCGAESAPMPYAPPRVVGVALEAVKPPTPKREYVIAMTSKHSGFCESCRGSISPGQEILWATVAKRARHRECQSSIA